MSTTEPLVPVQENFVLTNSQFRLFRDLIYKTAGISLADNKLEFVQSRLSKRLRHLKLTSFSDYYKLLEKNDYDGSEMQQMINRITTNKTNFFREEHHFEYLRDTVLARIIQQGENGQRPKKLRIWCAASSTGEEPYSLAMTVREAFAGLHGWDLRILASDIDTEVLQKAKNGVFRGQLAEEIPQALLNKHFDKQIIDGEQCLKIRPATAELVTFRRVNLLESDWPIRTHFDAIFCRNVLIYFDAKTQEQIMRQMANFLSPDGSLFIGHSESLTGLSDTFARVGKTVYERTTSGLASFQNRAPGKVNSAPAKPVAQASLPRDWIVVGEVKVSNSPRQICTTLGSCIAVCLYDPQTKIGGMNHFALPSASGSRTGASIGIHAMELLINQIMQLGGDRSRFIAKVFGGANVLHPEDPNSIGQRNQEFIREFLHTERIPIQSEHLGGDRGMQVYFEPHTGRVRVKLLDRREVVESDIQIETQTSSPEPVADVTLF